MKNNNALFKKESLNESHNFYKALEEKSHKFKSSQTSVKQSRARQNSKVAKCPKGKKVEAKTNKEKRFRTVLCVPEGWANEKIAQVNEGYNFDRVINKAETLAEFVHNTIHTQKPKFISISLTSSPSSEAETKTSLIQLHMEPLIKPFEKATISIYSICHQPLHPSPKLQFYDMLSIRRQIKTETKLLVQTNICNNSKSGIILRKLLDVAREREKLMRRDIEVGVVVVKIRGLVSWDKENCNGGKEVQIEICVGGYGEIGNKDLMGAERLREYFHVIQMGDEEELAQIQDSISEFKKKEKSLKSNQLIEKIRNLQTQLNERKRELEEQRQRVAEEQAIEAELEDIVLPSQRPMVNIEKYETRYNVGTRKISFRPKNQ